MQTVMQVKEYARFGGEGPSVAKKTRVLCEDCATEFWEYVTAFDFRAWKDRGRRWL